MKGNLPKDYTWLYIAGIGMGLLFMAVFSFSNLTTKPRIWVDESLNIDIAHNIVDIGVANIATGPSEFPSRPYTIATTGYAVTYPLALFFNLFGFGAPQARVYAFLWMVVFILTLAFFIQQFFSLPAATFAVLLTVTFATFYDDGRTVVGDLPGFIFFLWGFYFLFIQKNFLWWGVMWGLAISTKPSLYLPLLLVATVYAYWERAEISMKNIARFVYGVVPPILLWVALFFPHPFSLSTWKGAIVFFRNPFSKSLAYDVRYSLSIMPSSSTIQYFVILGVAIVAAFFLLRRDLGKDIKLLYKLLFLYCILDFLYFLRSPGWLRYLFPLELIFLMMVYPAFHELYLYAVQKMPHHKSRLSWLPLSVVSMLLVAQIIQLFFFSSILSSPIPEGVSAYLQQELKPGETAGIINEPYVAAFVPRLMRQQHFFLTGMPVLGTHPLSKSVDELPRILVFQERDRIKYIAQYADILDKYYIKKGVIFGTQIIYQRIP